MIAPEYVTVTDADTDLAVQFVDFLVPQLAAGAYTLTASQTLTKNNTGVDEKEYLPTEAKPVTQQVEVRAPRFTVQPDWVHGSYPPAGSAGLYSAVLPHVTLTRPTLPWERDIKAAGTGTDPAGRLPWMALLLFAEGELEKDPHCLGTTEQRTAAEVTATEQGARHAADRSDDLVLPAFDLSASPVVDQAEVCRTIAVGAEVFHALAPTVPELPLLTHLRRVNEQHQQAFRSLDEITIGDYAVLVSGRLPRAAGGRYIAHLVSLEGWIQRLPTTEQSTYQGKKQTLRLVSLWSSAFETLPDRMPGFAALTENFLPPAGSDGSKLLLTVPSNGRRGVGTVQKEVQDRLTDGFLPVACRTEAGRMTFGWYRGPFTPVLAAARSDAERRRCAAEAMICLKRYGIWDVSHAVAFTAGRGVALSDRDFTAALLRLRAKSHDAARLKLRTMLPAGSPPDHGVSSPRGGARVRLEELITGAGPALAGALGAPLACVLPTVGDHEAAPVTPVVSPAPVATRLPVTAGITRHRVRDEPELRARLEEALAALTGTPPAGDTARDHDGDGGDGVPPDEDLLLVREWLTGLRSLQRVPFPHLVPDARMLPPESLRFFYLDQDWITTLVEGALSVGVARDFDLAADETLLKDLLAPPGPMTGMLIRSQLVPGWPALEVRPYPTAREAPGNSGQHTAREKPLRVIRREVLAGDVLLVLFDGVPGRVELAEPAQGIHFGIDEPAGGHTDDPLDDGIIRLRHLNAPLGKESEHAYPDKPGLRSLLRSATGPDNVLKIADLAQGLRAALAQHQLIDTGAGTGDALSAAQFALQMINAAQRRTFSTDPRTTA